MGVMTAPFDPAQVAHEAVTGCPVCETPSAPATPEADRYGFAVRVSSCVCGLQYLNPRPTRAAYASFYREHYRELLRTLPCYQGEGAAQLGNTEDRIHRGMTIGGFLRFHRPILTVRSLLDVGGSTGHVAEGFTRAMPTTSVTVLDPNGEELAEAAARGYATAEATAEDAPPLDGVFDGMICAQTADHWCEPLRALRWMRSVLAAGGWLYLDIVNMAAKRRSTWPRWKLDHPLYWTERAIRLAFARTGWRVRGAVKTPDHRRIGFFCEGA